MFKRSSNLFTFLTPLTGFMFLTVCLMVGLVLTRHFISRDSVVMISDQHDLNKDQGLIELPHLEGLAASHYLQYSAEGESLRAAVKLARFGIEERKLTDPTSKTRVPTAISHDQNLETEFGDYGPSVRSTNSEEAGLNSWRMDLRFKSFGYSKELDSAPPVRGRSVNGNRIEYQRSGDATAKAGPQLIEWYENGPTGLEQGFTINERPERRATAADEPLRVLLSIHGNLRTRLKAEGQEIELIDAHGQRALTYSKLSAKDAKGRLLNARMETEDKGQEIVLVVNDQDAAYPIVIDPLMWTQQAHLFASNGSTGDLFGNSVAISGNTAVVGAVHDSYLNRTPGFAYVFVRTGQAWTEQARLRTNDSGPQGGLFGCSVSVSGDTVVVGAKFMNVENLSGANSAQGAAYVFVRSGTAWSQQARLIADDGLPLRHFGYTVAINADTVIVGSAANAAYVYKRTAGIWAQQQKLTQSDGVPGSAFGYVVAISGETAIVSGGHVQTPAPPGEMFGIGKVYVFQRTGGTWNEQAKLSANDRILGDAFGSSIAISGDTVVVSYYNGRNNLEHPERHGAYVFVRAGSGWSQQAKLTSGTAERANSFVAVGCDKNTVMIGYTGGSLASGTEQQGNAYVFVRRSGEWFGLGKVDAPGVTPKDSFGSSVSVSGESAIVGAPWDEVALNRAQGSAYIFMNGDTDGDGLPDEWETNGLTIDGVFIDLKAMGANPMHKDIFIHADWMQPSPAGVVYKPNPAAIKMVVDAFAVAPVENPDKKKGIRLHIDLGPNSPMTPGKNWNALSKSGQIPYKTEIGIFNDAEKKVYNWGEVDLAKTAFFGPSKRKSIFHYVMFCNTFAGAMNAGISRGINGADFLITFGHPSWASTRNQKLLQASMFMHELGHNLGLPHGGGDSVNYKPNYLSDMNYRFSFTGLLSPNGRQRKLDYSRLKLADLNERSLLEAVGISDPLGHLTNWNSLPRPLPNKCESNPNGYYKLLPRPALDWDCNGVLTAGVVTPHADLNGDGICVRAGADNVLNSTSRGGDDQFRGTGGGQVIESGGNRKCESTKQAGSDDEQAQAPGTDQPDLLFGFNDWPALIYDGGGQIGAFGSAAPLPTMTELDEPTIDDLLRDVPPALLEEEDLAPIDEVTASTGEGIAPLTVTFDGSASTAVNGTIVDWTWDFGDETTGSGSTVTHTYNTPGEYYASVTVTDSNGRVNLVPSLIQITVNEVPVPTPTPTPTPIPTPTPVPTPIPPQPGRVIVNIADSTDPQFGVFDPPQINNNRVVLFGAAYNSNPRNCEGGYLTKTIDGPLVIVAERGLASGCEFKDFAGGHPSINDNGAVSFVSRKGSFGVGESRVLVKDGTTLTVISDLALSPFEHFNSSFTSINNNLDVAFSANYPAGGQGIFRGNGGPLTTVADTRGGVFTSHMGSAQDMNDNGTVAFYSDTLTGFRGIFAVASGGAITTIADSSSVFRFFIDCPSINNAGTVVFSGEKPNLVGIYSGSGGAITPIAEADGPFFNTTPIHSFVDFPAINSSGTVVFGAILKDGRRGIFVGPDIVADKIIATGDGLFGSIVTNVQFFRGLNDNGDIGFSYRLQNNTVGVALALAPSPSPTPTPTPTPTPSPTPAGNTIQFSEQSYSFDEGQVGTVVTITRSGDTSSNASVLFQTVDDTSGLPCDDVVNNLAVASARCDYSSTITTVSFAPGETQKIVSLPFIDDVYIEGPEYLALQLSAAQGASLGSASATVSIIDNDFNPGVNPVLGEYFFVRQHYLDFLNREPDAPGLAFWTNEIASCGTDVQCLEVKRINVSAAFYLSIEFQQTGYLIYRLSQAAFNTQERLPLSRFLPDTRKIGRNVIVLQNGWEQQLEQNKQEFIDEFIARESFIATYPVTMGAAEFVDALSANTGGSISQTERDALIGELSTGTKTRAQVLRRIAEDDDFVRTEFTRGFVLMQYFGYLRRAPNELPDGNFDGFNFWLTKLNQFNGNFINAEMVKTFIVSGEYLHRFGL